jgi:hypothetical protein
VEGRAPAERCSPAPAGTSIVFDMSLTYILVALAAVLLNNVLVERLSLHTRITAGAPPSPPAPHPASQPCCPSEKWVHFPWGPMSLPQTPE